MTGQAVKLGRKFCGQKCKSEHRRFPHVYRVWESRPLLPRTECTTDSKSAHSTRVKTRLSVDRASPDAVEHRIGPGDYPVNILGGYRWPGTKPLEPQLLATILNAEIGDNWLDWPPATEGAAP